MFEENYRREMQAALPSAAATDALERRMDALRAAVPSGRRYARSPSCLLALLLLAVPLLPALLQPQTQGYEALLSKLEGMSGYRALSPNDFLFSSDSVMEVGNRRPRKSRRTAPKVGTPRIPRRTIRLRACRSRTPSQPTGVFSTRCLPAKTCCTSPARITASCPPPRGSTRSASRGVVSRNPQTASRNSPTGRRDGATLRFSAVRSSCSAGTV